MVDWPNFLVRELAARRCIIFIGAGVSAAAKTKAGKRPLIWKEFLERASALVPDTTRKRAINNLIKSGNNLLALQLIKDYTDSGDFRDLLSTSFNDPAFEPAKLHELIFKLDAKVVITTNFDKIYERYCHTFAEGNAFKVVPYTSKDICDELRSDTRLIVKAHGSIDQITDMVFTRGEYHRTRSNHARFYDVLKALFMTHTILFLGCGLQDPDMMLLLEDVKIVSAAEQPHYAVIKKEKNFEAVIADWKSTYNVRALTYGPSHEDLATDLTALVESVLAERARLGIPQ